MEDILLELYSGICDNVRIWSVSIDTGLLHIRRGPDGSLRDCSSGYPQFLHISHTHYDM